MAAAEPPLGVPAGSSAETPGGNGSLLPVHRRPSASGNALRSDSKYAARCGSVGCTEVSVVRQSLRTTALTRPHKCLASQNLAYAAFVRKTSSSPRNDPVSWWGNAGIAMGIPLTRSRRTKAVTSRLATR